MKNCLINQPGGLGDIMFIQPIIDNYIRRGYIVHYPILSEYFQYVPNYIKKEGLVFYDVDKDSFPMIEYFGAGVEYEDENNLYVPLEYSDNYIISNAPNIAKYFYTRTPLSDWRSSLNVERNYDREKLLIDTYNLYGDYIILNEQFTGLPYIRNITIESDMPIIKMDWQTDRDNGFNPFDWISAFEGAKEIHSVGTSICYLIDKYCFDNKIFIYERRIKGQQRNYHRDHYLVYRNPNWVYMD